MSEEEIKKLVLEFHNTYEKLSTEYNYETRKDTRQFDFNSPNGKLMYAVIRKVVVPKLQQKESIIKEVREKLNNYTTRMEALNYQISDLTKNELLEILDKEKK